MSQRYKGGVISATPPTTSTSSASGVWTEQQFMQGVASGSWPALAGAPTIGTATAGALNASVAFTAPTYTGSGITGYTATSSPGGITGTGASSPITVSGLTAGTAYTFTVTATTAAGQSSASAASNSVTPTAPQYIEDVFSTYLYTGNGSTQTITNNIDLSTKGGLVWIKNRTQAASHYLQDTVRGANNFIITNNTNAEASLALNTVFNTDGFSQNNSFGGFNGVGDNYASWTFREQPKFFDVVTWSGNSTARTIAHNLGSAPGCIIVKAYSGADAGTANWAVYHQSLGNGFWLKLESTSASLSSGNLLWTTTAPTSTEFSLGGGGVTEVNKTGNTYVAYLFAHNAGGFGLSGSENVISCGSYTGTGSALSVTLGYEPQWVMIKRTDTTADWQLIDNMRGWTADGVCQRLVPNTSAAEAGPTGSTFLFPTSTGFGSGGSSEIVNASGGTYIYIAIRRGPMKVPTSGTSVFTPIYATASAGTTRTVGFTADLLMARNANSGDQNWMTDRLRGFPNGDNSTPSLYTTGTAAEVSAANYAYNVWNTTAVDGFATAGVPNIWAYFGRAPSFFDAVCYTGTGGNQFVSHNLGVRPDLYIVKRRNFAANWVVTINASIPDTVGILNSTNAFGGSAYDNGYLVNGTVPASNFGAGFGSVNNDAANRAGNDYVAYLFATCAGVSKVGSYTGTGALQTINCGFTSGARFVLIKRTDSTGNWWFYDSARGITGGNDPYLFLNSTNAQVTGFNYVDTTSVGFQVTAAAPAQLNDPGGTFIFLAIA